MVIQVRVDAPGSASLPSAPAAQGERMRPLIMHTSCTSCTSTSDRQCQCLSAPSTTQRQAADHRLMVHELSCTDQIGTSCPALGTYLSKSPTQTPTLTPSEDTPGSISPGIGNIISILLMAGLPHSPMTSQQSLPSVTSSRVLFVGLQISRRDGQMRTKTLMGTMVRLIPRMVGSTSPWVFRPSF
jgi:hypothetical protein